ncbi:flagellar hook-length control protein FliK [Caulobacter sp. ErkDOM-YI]|uniref:flagellar hook-length control protein FliK n=1 Tax=unclassified Caulobacter TaxID=2648921 RepID=UPI003AF7D9AD
MADIEAVVVRPETPQTVRQAAKALLGSLIPAEQPVTSALVRSAFQGSGVFMETRLARSVMAEHRPIPSTSGDMKAALLVFRAVVSTWLAKSPEGEPSASGVSSAPGEYAAPARSNPGVSPTYAPISVASSTPDPSGVRGDQPYRVPTDRPPALGASHAAVLSTAPKSTIPATSAPALLAAPETSIEQNAPSPIPSTSPARTGPVAPTQTFLMVGLIEDEASELPLPVDQEEADPAHDPRSIAPSVSARAPARPPPPYAGGPLSAQAAVSSDLAGDLPPAELARRLLKGVDGAIARQELSQIASLPEPRGEAERLTESRTTRWVFDLPFQTPQGVAVAQFEVSRDGGGAGSDPGREIERTWRARFSLDVEPLGPVHVQIALTGSRTRVGLWAERPDAMARLQAGEAALSAALREAELSPEVAFHAGAPTVAVTAPGRFVDRAS